MRINALTLANLPKKSPSTKLGLKFREETSKKGNKGIGQKTFRLLQCNN